MYLIIFIKVWTVTTMTKEELLVYNRLLKELECASGVGSMANFWLDKLEQFVIIMNIKDTKAVPLDKFEIL